MTIPYLLGAALLLADPAPPVEKSPWQFTNAIGASINPIGVLDTITFRWEKTLYGSDNPLLKTNFFSASGALGIAPIYLRPTLRVEVQPLSILKLEVSYEPEFYFGNSGFITSYPYANADYPTSITTSAPASPSGGHSGVVHQLILAGTLQFAYGPFAFQNVAKGIFSVMSPHNGDRAFYNIDEDIMLASTGWMLHNTTVLLANATWGGSVGISHTLLATSYPASSYPPGASTVNENSPVSRLGPLFLYRFNDDETGHFQRPTLIFMLNWYARQRYRTGESVSGGVPYGLIAFVFTGDL